MHDCGSCVRIRSMHQPPLLIAQVMAFTMLAGGVAPTWAYIRTLVELSIDGVTLTEAERKTLMGMVLAHK